MNRKERKFFDRDENEQLWMTQNTWCDKCGKADFGLTDPVEYEENNKVYLAGKCRRCGSRVVTEITES